MKKDICLLNDSFPPQLDGVANTVLNYARVLQNDENFSPLVVVPDFPDANDSNFSFPIQRYPSIDLRKQFGYTAGNPFIPKTIEELKKYDIALLHSHCPIASNFLARGLREALNVPIVMTYHSRFDLEIDNFVKVGAVRYGAIKALVESVSSVDELWVVSEGAGLSLRQMGYEGDYIVMPNGVDMPRRVSTEEEIYEATKDYDLPKDVPVFLFVGRLRWYKGVRIILDALKALRSQNMDFRMIFIGTNGGQDEIEMKAYLKKLKLEDKCKFIGPVYDRNVLAAWYSRATLLLLPSTYDTNGLVVREAAACGTGSIVIKDSCAAEGIENGRNGLFIEDNAASMAVCLANASANLEKTKKIGERASEEIYISWDNSIKNAMNRYEIVIDNYKSGNYKRKHDITDELFTFRNDLLTAIDELEEKTKTIHTAFEDSIGRYL